MRNLFHRLVFAGLMAGALSATACVGSGQGYGRVRVAAVHSAPPAPVTVHYSERPGYVYVQGRWVWDGYEWQWTNGRWMRERNGYVYANGYWDHRGDQYVWVDGGWHAQRSGQVWIDGRWIVRDGRHVYRRGHWQNRDRVRVRVRAGSRY